MSLHRPTCTDAFVLRVVDYRDADRIVTLLTAQLGKVAVIARGARRSRRRFAGALEPYALITAQVALGHGEVGRMDSARVLRAHPRLLGDLRRMTLAGAATELVRETTPVREVDPRLFATLTRFYEHLDATESAHEEHLLAFQLRRLALAGVAPELTACGRCARKARRGQAAMLDPALGSVVCRACGGASIRLSGGSRARMGSAFGPAWQSLPAPWPPAELGETRLAIEALVEHHLGRRLPGAGVVAQVEELRAARGGSGPCAEDPPTGG